MWILCDDRTAYPPITPYAWLSYQILIPDMTWMNRHQNFIRRVVFQRKHQKLCVTGLCAENSPVTGELPAQRANKNENVSIWWRHHEEIVFFYAAVCMEGLAQDCSDSSALAME